MVPTDFSPIKTARAKHLTAGAKRVVISGPTKLRGSRYNCSGELTTTIGKNATPISTLAVRPILFGAAAGDLGRGVYVEKSMLTTV